MKNKKIFWTILGFISTIAITAGVTTGIVLNITNKPNKEINNNNNNNNDDNNNVKHSSDKQIEENKMNKNEKTYKDFFPSSHLI
ncbi:hypothetical protein ONA24_01260 [Mycoplasmopsis cynos]|uniref:hypothetical protein n=1 Tax=Mycoplasmopsis cynos TaxID=171284 RepID=UPI0024CC656D|nr:hypothetical protein [Mycoplasmopsis cynos]WAM09943.1 hypothetical protein ONA24_01260 [Mycoplasmopsis cynos]